VIPKPEFGEEPKNFNEFDQTTSDLNNTTEMSLTEHMSEKPAEPSNAIASHEASPVDSVPSLTLNEAPDSVPVDHVTTRNDDRIGDEVSMESSCADDVGIVEKAPESNAVEVPDDIFFLYRF